MATSPEPARAPHRVVVVGGGFAGLYAARSLGIDPEVRLTLVDRRNFHLFQPLLYQVATGALSPGDIAQPLRSHAAQAAQHHRPPRRGGRASTRSGREVLLADGGPIAYDTLVVATGAHHTYFDHDEWAAIAPGLKTLEDATEIRRRILIAFEAAEREADPARRAGVDDVRARRRRADRRRAGRRARRDRARHAPARLPVDPFGRGADHPGRGDGPRPAAVPAGSLGVGPAPAREARRRGPDEDARGRPRRDTASRVDRTRTARRNGSRPGPCCGRRAS